MAPVLDPDECPAFFPTIMRTNSSVSRTSSSLISPTSSSVSSLSAESMSSTSSSRGTPRTPRSSARSPSAQPTTPTPNPRGQPGSTSQTPRGPLMRTTVTTEIVGALNSPAPSVDPVIKVYRIPEPTDITVIDNAEKLYIVTKGEAVGIYDTWEECLKRIDNVFNHAIFQKVETWAIAFAIYQLAYYDGTLQVIPVPNGQFDTPSFTIPSTNGRQGTAMINLPPRGHRSRGIVAPYALRRPAIESGSFYAVVHGEEVGVYGTWHEAAIRTRHVASSKKVFTHTSWESALDAYTRAFDTRQLRISGQVITGQRLTIENIRFD